MLVGGVDYVLSIYSDRRHRIDASEQLRSLVGVNSLPKCTKELIEKWKSIKCSDKPVFSAECVLIG